MTRPPRPILTKRLVTALKPAAARYDVFDARLSGFMVRVHPSGRKTYRFKCLEAGRQRVITLGEYGGDLTTERARTDAEILRGRSRVGDLAAATARRTARKPLRVDDLIVMWLREGPASAPNKRASSWAHDASRLNRHIAPLLGKRVVAGLKATDIERAQADIAAGKTAADIRTGVRGRAIVRGGRAAALAAITTFGACLAWAKTRGLIDDNPTTGVRKIADVKRERFLSEAEAARLLATPDTCKRGPASARRSPTSFACCC